VYQVSIHGKQVSVLWGNIETVGFKKAKGFGTITGQTGYYKNRTNTKIILEINMGSDTLKGEQIKIQDLIFNVVPAVLQ